MTPASSASPPSPAKVLVVDDDAGSRDALARRLQRCGYQAETAADGNEALRLVGERPFDLVLLDVMMPGLNGLDVLERLRRSHPPTDLPVIMATARDASADVVQALKGGANDYVTKPLDFPVVLARVEGQLALKRAVEQVRELERVVEERNRALEAANQRLRRDLEAGARVQRAFLPRELPRLPGADFAWAFRPCETLGGDGLNILRLGEGHVGFYLLDVSGHGVASALLSVSLARQLAPPAGGPPPAGGQVPGRPTPEPPREVADRLNRLFAFDPATEQFATLVYAVLDVAGGECRYVSAGHPRPVLVPAGADPAVLGGQGLPIGLAEEPYEEQTVRLAVGDRLYLYTDGVVEAMNPGGDLFGTPRLLEVLRRGRALGLAESVYALLGEVERWQGGANNQDDVSILAVERRAEALVSGDGGQVSRPPGRG